MDISIIIPVFNVENYIERCINSIMNQFCENIQIECIIINDCTPDKSIDIINRMLTDYRGNIKFILLHNDTNCGQSIARNKAIRASTGKYIMFVDSDDYITDDAIEKLWNSHLDYPEVDLVIANYYSIKDAAPFNNGISCQTFVDGKRLRKMLMNYQVTCNPCWRLISRDIIFENELFFTPGIIFEDIIWSHRLFAVTNSAVVLPDVIYYYVNNPNSTTNSTKEKAILSVKSYCYDCKEMLKNPFIDVYADHQLYVLTFLMRALDLRRDYHVQGEASKELDKIRFSLLRSTFLEGRIILSLFFITTTYQPFYSLFNYRWIRSHYFKVESLIRYLANYTDNLIHKNK